MLGFITLYHKQKHHSPSIPPFLYLFIYTLCVRVVCVCVLIHFLLFSRGYYLLISILFFLVRTFIL